MAQENDNHKFDSEKPRMGLVLNDFSDALMKIGEVGTFGADKYSDGGWLLVPNAENRYTDAMYRHLFQEAGGEKLDSESDLHHAAHAAWNAIARLQLILAKEQQNDKL